MKVSKWVSVVPAGKNGSARQRSSVRRGHPPMDWTRNLRKSFISGSSSS